MVFKPFNAVLCSSSKSCSQAQLQFETDLLTANKSWQTLAIQKINREDTEDMQCVKRFKATDSPAAAKLQTP